MKANFALPNALLNDSEKTGNWLLKAGLAITITSRSGGQLCVARGRVWATLGSGRTLLWNAAPLAPRTKLTDYFLNAGDTLAVPPGASVVIESLGQAQSLPVAFAWVNKAPVKLAKRPRRAAVAQAAGELGRVLRQVLPAARRLAVAVLLGPKPEQRLETCP